jgi:hypothetical protein
MNRPLYEAQKDCRYQNKGTKGGGGGKGKHKNAKLKRRK